MWKQAREVLEATGYAIRPGDDALLRICADYAEAGLLCESNRMELPPELQRVCALRAVGAFLAVKQTFVPEDVANFPIEAAPERLKLGDSEVTFDAAGARASAEQHMSALVAALLSYGRGLAACFRSMPW